MSACVTFKLPIMQANWDARASTYWEAKQFTWAYIHIGPPSWVNISILLQHLNKECFRLYWAQMFPRNLLHTATSKIRSVLWGSISSSPTSNHSSIASLRFSVSSSFVSPYVKQPGSAGTSAQKPAFFGFVYDCFDFHASRVFVGAVCSIQFFRSTRFQLQTHSQNDFQVRCKSNWVVCSRPCVHDSVLLYKTRSF